MLSDRHQLLGTNRLVDETTHRFIFFDDGVQIIHKGRRINNLVGIVTTASEGDGHLLIFHIADVFDGAGLKLEHNKKKSKGLSEVF